MNVWFVIVFVFCITAHLVAATVVAVFARKRVQFLSLAVVLAILTIFLGVCLANFHTYEQAVDIGIIHPSVVLPLAASAFLESIYPLGFVMPGFLQWQRMVKYALPAIIVVSGYFTGVMIVGHAPVLHNLRDVMDNLLLVPDVFIRIVALGLAIYYIIGIVRLPKRLLRSGTKIPYYLKGYCTWLTITYACFIALSLTFHWWLLYLVLIGVTVINMSFMLQSIERIAESLPMPMPVIEPVEVEEAPQEAEAQETVEDAATEETPAEKPLTPEERDFNEENLERFRRAEHFMKTAKEWRDVGFTRDTICEAVGFNRHLLLQCLRSQGYNNVHEYIAAYRIAALREIVSAHSAESLTEACRRSGFATIVTARSSYKKILARDLDEDWGKGV